ncbi:MAG TPA: diguanylate cyclase [Trueperaceae bacterium]
MSSRILRYSDLWEAFFHKVPYGVAVLAAVRDDDDQIVDFEVLGVNEKALLILGRAEVELLGCRLREVEPDLLRVGLFSRLARALESGEGVELEHSVPGAPGSRDAPTWYSITVIPAGERLIITLSSITRRKAVLFEAVKMMSHDELTGVGNRRLLKNHFWMKRRQDVLVSMLYFDLNGFKEINDRCGHETGDEVLRVVAQRIEKNIRPNELVARLGGDEFAVLLDSGDRVVVEAVAERLRQEIVRPITLADATVQVRAALGIAVYPEDGVVFRDLLRAADRQMYENKKEVRGLAGK